MRSPRTIAEKTNDSALFEETPYDYEAGTPPGVATRRSGSEDYAANPTNPSEPAAPCKNMKR